MSDRQTDREGERERVGGNYSALSAPINALDTIYKGNASEQEKRERGRERVVNCFDFDR